MSETAAKYETNGALAVLPRAERPLSDAVALAISQQNLKDLSDAQKVEAIRAICAAAQLPVALSPIMLLPGEGGRLVPYVTAAGTNTIRANKRISIEIIERAVIDGGAYMVRVRATAPDGVQDESVGVVPLEGLKGVALANALMKAETKAKRRVTLSIAGIGFMDESEIDQVRGAGQPMSVTVRDDSETIEVDRSNGDVIDIDPAEPDWIAMIADAPDLPYLYGIGERMASAGISRTTHRPLFAAFNARKIKLSEASRAEQDEAARDEQQRLNDETVGFDPTEKDALGLLDSRNPDRFTQ